MVPSNGSTFNFKSVSFWNGLAVALFLIYFGKPLLIPMSFGLLLAIVAYPGCRWLESKKIPRSVSASILIIGICLLFLALLFLLGTELNILIGKKQEILTRMDNILESGKHWLESSVGIELKQQEDFANRVQTNLEKDIGGTINGIISAAGSAIVSLILIPLFGVLFLLHRHTFVLFLESFIGEDNKKELRKILQESILSYFRFVKGTFFVYCIVAVLNSAGLLLLGIDHAVLFGVIAAFMTIIPYVGIIISAALPISIALITKDSLWYPAGVVIVFSFVQYLEANVIYPRIVGAQLNLSTWAVLVTIIAGTILWGVAGMILFVPFLGILKIISDHVPHLRSVNILISRSKPG